jgi:hypothetical protein
MRGNVVVRQWLFGSRWSRRNRPDDVKLDHQLIAPIVDDGRAATIARSAIDLAKAFGITSVAEGVEDRETAIKLKELGCDAVQGNFFCHPLPARDIAQVPSNLALMAHQLPVSGNLLDLNIQPGPGPKRGEVACPDALGR